MHAGADRRDARGQEEELIGFQTGMRESGQSWKELLVDLQARGLVVAPQAAIGDGGTSSNTGIMVTPSSVRIRGAGPLTI